MMCPSGSSHCRPPNTYLYNLVPVRLIGEAVDCNEYYPALAGFAAYLRLGSRWYHSSKTGGLKSGHPLSLLTTIDALQTPLVALLFHSFYALSTCFLPPASLLQPVGLPRYRQQRGDSFTMPPNNRSIR